MTFLILKIGPIWRIKVVNYFYAEIFIQQLLKIMISSSVKSLTAIFGLLVDQEELAHLRLIKGIVMQIEEALTNDRQCVLKIT